MHKKLLIPLILAGIGVIVLAVLYFSTKNDLFMLGSLLCVGLVNVVNGFIFSRNGARSSSTIFFIGGSLLSLLMLVAILFQLL